MTGLKIDFYIRWRNVRQKYLWSLIWTISGALRCCATIARLVMEVLVSGATFADFLKRLKEEPGDAVSCRKDTRCMDYI